MCHVYRSTTTTTKRGGDSTQTGTDQDGEYWLCDSKGPFYMHMFYREPEAFLMSVVINVIQTWQSFGGKNSRLLKYKCLQLCVSGARNLILRELGYQPVPLRRLSIPSA